MDELRSLTILGMKLLSGGTAADALSFARWQQGEQTVVGVGVVFSYPHCRHLTSPMSQILCNWVSVMFCVILTTH